MENKVEWHYKSPSLEEKKRALNELAENKWEIRSLKN
jgi:transposase-like protein